MFEIFQEYEKKASQEENRSSFEEREKVFVLSVGGSLFFDEKPALEKIAGFAELLGRLHDQGHKFVVVVGGGKPAREYVSAAKSLGATNFSQDELGIMVTRTNALLFISAIDKSFPKVLTDPIEALDALSRNIIPVFGGLIPSFTTDAVAALVAEAVGGDFVNLTDVDGVYTADPKKSRKAQFFDEISYDELISLIKKSTSKPGQNFVIDLPCASILKRSQIKGTVLNGNDLENFESMVLGQSFKGTVIRDYYLDKDTEETEG